MSPHQTTALRGTGHRTDEGWVLLRDVGSSYRDGAEDALYELVMAADPAELASTRDTLLSRARGWAQQYHVHPARANVLRPLTLEPGLRVLEIGAGCGAVSRHLGESGALVDALEPVPARARVARARTRDLPNVEVFVGELDDVPADAVYDVVVVVGVLEYVGGGSQEDQPYLDFLRGISSRLAPGGSLVLTIENKLGAKYLAGAAEDHTGRVFDSLESYPHGGPARTFSRRTLEHLVREVGLEPTTRVAFPDYKITRTVLDPALFVSPDHASLLVRVPSFPSPDWATERPRLVNERRLWASLVEAGLATETGNSLVLVARDGRAAGHELWPDGLAGEFFSTGRRSAYATRTRLVRRGDELVFERLRTTDEERGSTVRLQITDAPFLVGEDFVATVAAAADPWDRLAELVSAWTRLLAAPVAEGAPTPVDLVPHNLLVQPDGTLAVFDQEWTSEHATVTDVTHRGVLWLAVALSDGIVPERLGDPELTVGDLARRIGALAGLDPDGHWISPAVEWEAAFQAEVQQAPEGEDVQAAQERHRLNLLVTLGEPLARRALGEREDLLRRRAEATVTHLTDVLATTERRLTDTQEHLADVERRLTEVTARSEDVQRRNEELDAELTSIRRHPVVLVARTVTRGAARVAPEGSLARRAYRAAKRKGSAWAHRR